MYIIFYDRAFNGSMDLDHGKSLIPIFNTYTLKLFLKHLRVVSATFLLLCFLSLNEGTCETKCKSSFCSQENQILKFYIFRFHDIIKRLKTRNTFC